MYKDIKKITQSLSELCLLFLINNFKQQEKKIQPTITIVPS